MGSDRSVRCATMATLFAARYVLTTPRVGAVHVAMIALAAIAAAAP